MPPQDSFRSVVYRSFVTCDDPKGVVECGTFRKYKTGSHKMKHKIESQQQQEACFESSSRSLASKIESEDMGSKRGSEEFHGSSSLQLLEVSRGAEKLNRMIGSWSRRMSFDGQSEDVAKDLLKGALDLQESLVMLGKLQEASKYMAQLKKQKQKRLMVDGMEIGRSRSDRFSGQNRRVSVDGPSRDCLEQLREVIRESFTRQNLMPPNSRTEEKTCIHQRSFDLDSEMPSTSSSQSSTDRSHSNRFGSTVSSLSPAASHNKAKGPNLIAKLMGLEEFPSKPVAKKPQFTVKKVDPELKTVKEVPETVKFKGVLKDNSVKDFKSRSNRYNDAYPRYRSVHDSPPIVLIKPIRSRWHDSEASEPTLWEEEEALKRNKLIRQLKTKDEHPPEIVNCDERILNNKMLRKAVLVEGKTLVKTPCRVVGKDSKEEVRKPDEEGVKTREIVSKDSKEEVRTPDEEVVKTRGIASKDSNDVLRKLDEEVVKTKGRASNKLKASEHRKHKQPKKEAIDKRVDKIQKVASTSRKPVEKEVVQSQSLSSSEDQARVSKTKLGHSENGSNIRKLQNSGKQNRTPHLISKSPKQPVMHNFSGRKRTRTEKEKPKNKPASAQTIIESLECQKDKNSPTSENESSEKDTNATLTDQLTTEDEVDASELQIEEDFTGSPSALGSTTMPTPKQERDTPEETLENEGHDPADSKSSRTHQTKLEACLLGSPSFLTRVEDLFDLNVSFPLSSQAPDIEDCGVASAEVLSLDCANEVVKRRSLLDSRKIHPLLLACTGKTRISISLYQLLEEVCEGVETLRSYTKLGSDNLYAILERDIWSNGVVNGVWDLGWRNGFSVDEAEQVVSDIEKLLLSELIEEAIS